MASFNRYIKRNWWKIFFPPVLALDAALWMFRRGMELLVPLPEFPGLPQDRGDERSPTYGWDGMRTSTGQGLTMPVVLGRHGVPGQVIYQDVFASQAGGAPVELLRVVLFLSEGQIRRIGDQVAVVADGLGGFAGGASGGTIPAGLRVNNNLLDASLSLPGARVWLRPGTLSQPALPTDPFRGATAILTVGEQLEGAGDEFIFTVTSDDAISTVGFAFAAPGGIFQQDSQGNQTAYPVSVSLAWRPEGLGSWRSFYDNVTPVTSRTFATTPTLGSFVETFSASLQPSGVASSGPIEVRVTRTTAAGSSTSVRSSLIWRSVSIGIVQEFAYPGAALLALEIPAGSRFSGGTPQFLVPVDGVLVRVWDATDGFSLPCWDVPAAPFDFHAFPPGRNPAWLLGEFLTNKRWGLGTYLSDDQVDWPALRRWADFCDADPNPADPWGEASFCCDLVLDAQRSAWDYAQMIASAGRASLTWISGKVSVVYRYRDAHGDTPAKAPLQLITAGNCEDVRVRWLSRGDRATAFQYQFLNEAKLWAQDVQTEEDQEAPAIEDPTDPDAAAWRPESVQSWGITRSSQLLREATWAHRANRLVRRELSFSCGPWLLAAAQGDLFQFQHELLRPFDSDVPLAMQVLAGGDSVTEITVDHVVSGGGLAFAGRTPTGAPIHKNVTAAIATTVRGKAATRLQFTGSIALRAGATVAVGLQDKLVETYEVLAISLKDDVRRDVRAIQWVPEIYDPLPAPADPEVPPEGVLLQPDIEAAPPQPADEDLVVVALGGSHRIAWHRPAGRGLARTRVFARLPEAPTWFLLEETIRDHLDVTWFAPWRTYEISVVTENLTGDFATPESGTRLTFVAEEFPPFAPGAPTNARVLQVVAENRLVVRWDPSDTRDLDYYEVRSGADWAAGQVVYRGRQAEAWLSPPPAYGVLQVAARSVSGLYGPRAQVLYTIEVLHSAAASSKSWVKYLPTGSGVGTHSNTAKDTTTLPATPFFALDSGFLSGTWTSDIDDLSTEDVYFLRVEISLEELDGITVGDCAWQAGSGEARWRTVGARPASAGAPGIDWSHLVGDLTMTLDDLPDDLRAGGTLGEVGSHVQAIVESRVFAGGGWGDWREHVDQLVVCSRWQIRIHLRRSSTARSIRVRALSTEALI